MTGDRFSELRADGFDADDLRADAQAAVDEALPTGWVSAMVRSPWPQDVCPVPACGRPIDLDAVGVGVLTKRLERPRTLLVSMVVVCDRCVSDVARLGVLATLTFQ